MKPFTFHTASAFLLITAFACSGPARALDCACEVAAGKCTACCGTQDSGFKHCKPNPNPNPNPNGPLPPSVMAVPEQNAPESQAPAKAGAAAKEEPSYPKAKKQ